MRKVTIAALVAAFALITGAETKVGVIGLDTSHALAFTKMMNVTKPDFTAGFRVVAAHQWGSRDIVSSTNRYPKYIAEMKGMGVAIVPSIAELLQQVDVVLLETNDGREHLKQAEQVFRSGKLCFIDKPITASYADAAALVQLGKKLNAKWFSSSGLRYSHVMQEARKGLYGEIVGAEVCAPSPFEEQGTHSDYYWYGIHGFEPLVTIMGPGVVKVSCARGDKTDVITGIWKDGRVGTVRAMKDNWTYGGYILPKKAYKGQKQIMVSGYEGYEPLLKEILTFFRTGVVPVDPDETLNIFAFMEAAAISARNNGEWVNVSDLSASDGCWFLNLFR